VNEREDKRKRKKRRMVKINQRIDWPNTETLKKTLTSISGVLQKDANHIIYLRYLHYLYLLKGPY